MQVAWGTLQLTTWWPAWRRKQEGTRGQTEVLPPYGEPESSLTLIPSLNLLQCSGERTAVQFWTWDLHLSSQTKKCIRKSWYLLQVQRRPPPCRGYWPGDCMPRGTHNRGSLSFIPGASFHLLHVCPQGPAATCLLQVTHPGEASGDSGKLRQELSPGSPPTLRVSSCIRLDTKIHLLRLHLFKKWLHCITF